MPPVNVWFKSSHSAAASNSCVEVRFTGAGVGVRDSTRRSAGTHWVTPAAWQMFVQAVRSERL